MAGTGLTENAPDWSEPLPPVAIVPSDDVASDEAAPDEVAADEVAATEVPADALASDEIAPQAPSRVTNSLLAEIADETNPLSAFGAEPEAKPVEPEPEIFSSETPGAPVHATLPAGQLQATRNKPLLFGIAAAITLAALVVAWLLQAGTTSADPTDLVVAPQTSTTGAETAPASQDQLTSGGLLDAPTAESAPAELAPASAAVEPASAPPVETPAIPRSTPGSLTVKVPALLQVLERGRLVGRSDAERITLPPGRHTLVFASEELGFQVERRVTIGPGATTTLNLELPNAPLAINALPWAEVWVDDERVGETPIGNLTRSIGPHNIVFRHPSLGERRVSVVVTLKEPARVSVDLRAGN